MNKITEREDIMIMIDGGEGILDTSTDIISDESEEQDRMWN